MDEARLIVAGVLGTIGALLVLIAAVGVVRMPDLLTRMQASSKAGTLGAICVLAGVAIDFADPAVAVRALLIIVFLFLTAPVAAHAIARAGYRSGAAGSDAMVVDELARDRSARPGASRESGPGAGPPA